jgi:hypothetical protein
MGIFEIVSFGVVLMFVAALAYYGGVRDGKRDVDEAVCNNDRWWTKRQATLIEEGVKSEVDIVRKVMHERMAETHKRQGDVLRAIAILATRPDAKVTIDLPVPPKPTE